jgi:hypothetical protein
MTYTKAEWDISEQRREAHNETLLEREMGRYKREEVGMWLWLLLFFLAAVGLVGCGKSQTDLTPRAQAMAPAPLKIPAEPTHVGECLKTDGKGHAFWMPCNEPLAISQLRYEIHMRGLHFDIICFDDDQFIAVADTPETEAALAHGMYIEDGVKPHWNVSGRTQESAAKNLLAALKYPPNIIPGHRPKEKDCPPTISGN